VSWSTVVGLMGNPAKTILHRDQRLAGKNSMPLCVMKRTSAPCLLSMFIRAAVKSMPWIDLSVITRSISASGASLVSDSVTGSPKKI